MEHFSSFVPLLLLFMVMFLHKSPGRKKAVLDILKKQKERGPGVMPAEFLKEFIGQVCRITVFDGNVNIALLVAVEGSWLKVEEDGQSKLINGDLIRDISAMPEKYQEKYRAKRGR